MVAFSLDDVRAFARACHAKGDLDAASDAQTTVLAIGSASLGLGDAASGGLVAADFLFAGLLHHAAGRLTAGIQVLRDGLAHDNTDPALHENLAVLLLAGNHPAAAIEAAGSALACGSDSPNVHDCLCDAYQRIGRPDLAVAAGRRALEAKDRRFGAASPIVTIRRPAPPAFDAGRPERNVIAYSLWGNQPRYHLPLLQNARIRPDLFPEWTIRVYHDSSVDPAFLAALAAHDVRLVPMTLPPDVPAHRALLWRFEVIADPAVSRFLIRDADSLLTAKERSAVGAWLASGRHFHAMRDWFSHTDLLLAGLWGGVGGILPPPATLWRAYTPWRMENDHIDQDLLGATVWPAIRHDILIHDSIFHPCLGSVPFPSSPALPPGQHIGQNAFLDPGNSG